jgi:hypothetical protein
MDLNVVTGFTLRIFVLDVKDTKDSIMTRRKEYRVIE